MTGVEEQTGASGGSFVDHGDDAERIDDWGPPPWRSPWSRLMDRVTAPVRPWVSWFGPRRLLGGAVTVVVAVGVGWWLVRPAAPPTEARLPYATSAASTTVTDDGGVPTASAAPGAATSVVAVITPTEPAVMIVHVAGAVTTPGIVEVLGGSRVADAIAGAGGAGPHADLAAVNLAAVLQDGQQVYVPTLEEQRPPAAGATASATDGSTSEAVGPVDLNRATASELDALPGVGPATAAAIVDHRDANGPFGSVDDLEAVRGIGPAKLEALRGLVTT